jgi:Plavaka transposase
MVLCSLGSSLSQNVSIILLDCIILLLIHQSYLAIREFRDDGGFHKFHHQLLHLSLAKILESLKPGMTTPEVVHFSDGHFRKVIYGLGPYIADYLEQALLCSLHCTRLVCKVCIPSDEIHLLTSFF